MLLCRAWLPNIKYYSYLKIDMQKLIVHAYMYGETGKL